MLACMLVAAGGRKHAHRLPDGVRTNVFFAEVPQYTIIMA